MPRHQYEMIANGLNEWSYPFLLGNIGTGKTDRGEAGTYRRVELPPLRQKGVEVVALRAHAGPTPKTVGLVSDLKSEEARTQGSSDVSCLFGGRFRSASRKVEPIDEPPIERINESCKCIDCSRRDD